MVEDISEQRRVEALLSRLFELSPDAICIGGFDGLYRRASDSWARALGIPEEKLIGVPWINTVHPDDVRPSIEFGKQFISQNDVQRFENRHRVADGSYCWMEWTGAPLHAEELVFTVGRDITLSPPQQGEKLNYFVFPYAEADGRPMELGKSMWRFSWKDE